MAFTLSETCIDAKKKDTCARVLEELDEQIAS
jgi:hypothetical protein